MRDELVGGELRRQVEGAADDHVVGVGLAVGRVGMDQVREAEEQLAQRLGHVVVLLAEAPLVLTERPALGLLDLGGRDIAVASQLADLLRQLVDAGSRRIAAHGELAQLVVEGGRPVELLQEARVTTTSRRRAHRGRVGAQQADVDHESMTLPGGRSVAGCGSPGAGARSNSRCTASYVSWSSSWPTISADGIVRPRL